MRGWFRRIRLRVQGHEVLLGHGAGGGRLAGRRSARAQYEAVGERLVVRAAPLRATFEDRRSRRDAYWNLDGNHSVEENERLRARGLQGCSRRGATRIGWSNDRQALPGARGPLRPSSPRQPSVRGSQEAIAFCEGARPRPSVRTTSPTRAPTHETFVPDEDQDPCRGEPGVSARAPALARATQRPSSSRSGRTAWRRTSSVDAER
jgi:hypothetical protein